ncbi:DNA-binding NarL/FixJ family response regulator [Thermocatellispora tengchongensis]|uniref:DNA-binding NarL/FixJ family response regulator n=1 Tax=Thermocatellispora tengchongensis TaxID=1073253 RepID=A0A840PIT7_9ACTN|nr:response regulator [Thermocatellispora tengchongensis]MBB5138889.1 DNA-binding NarL/FixJ family response regulator [Thermocatellispora tengchongensis]
MPSSVVRQAAAVRATAPTEELQHSRERQVTGVAEERRRLRRDLHDGLGPTLAAAALKVQAVRNLMARDPGTAREALDQVRADLGGMLGDVRRLVHGLRPPALDQFGLAGALRYEAGRFRDDRPVYRDGLRMLLDSTGQAEVVGTAADGEEAVAEAARLRPQVVVMDLRMPRLDGVRATERIVAGCPGTHVLLLTMHEDDESVFAAMLAGARGYLLKGAGQTEILRAITAVAGGEVIFGPALAERITRYFARLAAAARPPREEPFPQLTAREREILDLIAAGLSNRLIAERLSLSPKTLRNNVSNVFAKLQVADRAQAIVQARQAGLGR